MPKNAYPNDENYPSPSFKKAVTAPDVDPDEGAVVIIGLNPAWIPVVEGALDQGMLPSTWEGDHDAKILALNRWDNLKAIFGSATVGEVPAPYWDDESADDADDEAPVDDQPWYGNIIILDDNLTFVENAFIWVVAGFIVYAGQPGAAISFVPLARRFVIEAKKNPLGGIIRFFRDAVQIGEVDTYSPTDGVVSVDIDLEAAAGGAGFRAETAPVLWLEMSDEVNPAVVGDPQIVIIRKRLDENEVYPTTMRYDETTDEIQTDYDGDDVWQDNPGLDFRHNTAYQFPPIDADDPQCQAAANMSRWVSDFLNEVTNTLSWATTAEGAFTTVMGGIALAFPEIAAVGVLAFLGLDLATVLFSAGVTAIQAAFDNDTLDEMTCIFYCHIEPDGTVTAAELGDINADIGGKIGGLAATVMTGMFLLVGEVGVTNWGARGEAPADCDDCDCNWCFNFNAATGLEDWDIGVSGGGSWNAGLGQWAGTPVGSGGYGTIYAVDITKTFTATAISSVSTRFGCSYNDGGRPTTILYLSGVQVGRVDAPYSQGAVQTDVTFEATFADVVCDTIRVYMASGTGCSVDQVITAGPDVNPFGVSNC